MTIFRLISVLTFALFTCLLPSFAGAQSLEGTGTIKGVVIDREGRPFQDAKVTAQPIECTESKMKLRSTYSSTNGQFTLTGLPAGQVLVSASAEKEGYPDSMFAVFDNVADNAAFQHVSLNAAETVTGVTVMLPPKGGRLTGAIIDEQTGEPVEKSRIVLIREDDPKLFLTTNPEQHAQFSFALPAKRFVLKVTAEGYTTWTSANVVGADPQGGILVSPDAPLTVTIRLRRLPGT